MDLQFLSQKERRRLPPKFLELALIQIHKSVSNPDGSSFVYTSYTRPPIIVSGYHSVRKDHPLELVVEPVPIHLPNIKSAITGIACGRAHTLVLTEKAGVLTLGNNAYGQCGRHIIEDEDYQRQSTVHQIVINDKISQVYCGQDHS